MPKPPEQIIAEFESRRIEAKAHRRKKFLRRAGFIFASAVLAGSVLFFSLSNPGTWAWMWLIPVCGYLMGELQKRWALEDELRRLQDEQRKTA